MYITKIVIRKRTPNHDQISVCFSVAFQAYVSWLWTSFPSLARHLILSRSKPRKKILSYFWKWMCTPQQPSPASEQISLFSKDLDLVSLLAYSSPRSPYVHQGGVSITLCNFRSTEKNNHSNRPITGFKTPTLSPLQILIPSRTIFSPRSLSPKWSWHVSIYLNIIAIRFAHLQPLGGNQREQDRLKAQKKAAAGQKKPKESASSLAKRKEAYEFFFLILPTDSMDNPLTVMPKSFEQSKRYP